MSGVFTEATLLAALRKRHAIPGNGGAGKYAFMTHVRTSSAFAQQEMDAISVALWPSEHHDVHAFEVKCSRTDWLREIKPDTRKSEKARELCDTFTVVAPKGVVLMDELPEGWGFIQATESDGEISLKQWVKPARLHAMHSTSLNLDHERTLNRGFVVAMLRASGAVPGMKTGKKRQASADIV